jgi:CubicO group peptidase (beta-lactamase class C family)
MQNSFPYRMLQLSFLAVVFLLTACFPRSAIIPVQPVTEDPFQAYAQEIDQLRKEFHTPGMSVAILKKREIVFAEGFGYADVKNKIPAEANTPYNIASLTKPFAAAILMKMVEQGQLDLDVEIATILNDADFPYRDDSIHGYANVCKKIKSISKNPFFRYGFLIRNYRCDTEKIKVKHHLTHTSQGIPGETYRYNGFLFKFLTQVAEEVSSKRFDELLVENIIAPLEMTRTVPNISKDYQDRVLTDRAKYYRSGLWGNFVPSSYPVKLSASAGMISTVIDLAKFDAAMDRNLIVLEETKQAMFTPTISNNGKLLPYGLGWFVQEYQGLKLIWHYGHAPRAYSSLILKVPEKEITLILLANSDGASAPFNLGAGDVLRSRFAVVFLKLFADLEEAPQ